MDYLDDYFRRFDADVTKYQYPEPFETVDDAGEFLQGFIDEMEAEEMLFLSILDEAGKFVGSAEVHGLKEDVSELGIWINKDQRQKGYAYEALSAAIAYAADTYKKNRFFYEADIRNEGSQKLLKKLAGEGSTQEGPAGEGSDAKNLTCEPLNLDKFTTESGKYLELQGYMLTVH